MERKYRAVGFEELSSFIGFRQSNPYPISKQSFSLCGFQTAIGKQKHPFDRWLKKNRMTLPICALPPVCGSIAAWPIGPALLLGAKAAWSSVHGTIDLAVESGAPFFRLTTHTHDPPCGLCSSRVALSKDVS